MSPDKKTGSENAGTPERDPAQVPTPARRDDERRGDRTGNPDVERERDPRPSAIPEPDRDPNRRLPQYTDVPKPEVQDG